MQGGPNLGNYSKRIEVSYQLKPFYYKTSDSETAHNLLFFSFLFSLNNAGIVICNQAILFSFFPFFNINFNIAFYRTESKSLEKFYINKYSLYPNLLLPYTYLGLLYLPLNGTVTNTKASATLVTVHIPKNLYIIFTFHHFLNY